MKKKKKTTTESNARLAYFTDSRGARVGFQTEIGSANVTINYSLSDAYPHRIKYLYYFTSNGVVNILIADFVETRQYLNTRLTYEHIVWFICRPGDNLFKPAAAAAKRNMSARENTARREGEKKKQN